MLSFMMNITVKEECENEKEAVEILSEIDKKANTHPGCINFTWFQHVDEPLKFTLIEQWENEELMEAHIEKITDLWNDFKPCLAEEPDSTQLYQLVQD